jgi:hypothetical protein
MRPDVKAFNEDVCAPGFMTGFDRGMWGIEGDEIARPTWPFVFIWVHATAKTGCPDSYHFRFALDGYPANAPIASPWDTEKQSFLEQEKWPRGGIVTMSIFNPGWKPDPAYGATLYAPCDRLSRSGHANWEKEYPDQW